MAQHDYVIDNQTGANFRADLNNALDAVKTNNSGSSAPSTNAAGQLWLDTSLTNNLLKVRDQSTTSTWHTLMDIQTGQLIVSSADINGGTIDATTLGSTVVFPAGHIIQFSKFFSASTATIGNLSSVSSGSPTTILTATINNVLASSKIFGFFYSGRMVLNSGQFIANTVTNGGSVDFDYQNQTGSGNGRLSPIFYFYDDSPATGTNSYDLTGYSNGSGVAAAYWCETGGVAYGWMLFEVAQ